MTAWGQESVSLIESGILLHERYRVRRSLSAGGFGATFEVVDEAAPRPNGKPTTKVLKVLNLKRFYDSGSKKKSIDLFQREARVLARLDHPGIPKVDPDAYFTWPDDATTPLYCLVMEYIEGFSLEQWLRKRNNQPVDETLAIKWLVQLLPILDMIHQQGLIHRDIKPSNIMLTPTGQLVLIDFGAVRDATATYLQGHSSGLTGTRIFAAGYTPNEQAEGRARPESDFFALGRTFVHLMTGIHPMGLSIDEQSGKLIWREFASHISTPLVQVLEELMEPFPGNRPRTAQMIMQQLYGEGIILSLPDTVAPVPEKPKFQPAPWPPLDVAPTPAAWAAPVWKTLLKGHTDQIRAIAVHPSNCLMASVSYDSSVKLWSLPDGKLFQTLKGHSGRLTAIAISPDGTLLASGGYDRQIRLWSLPDGDLLHTLPRQPDTIQALAFSPQKPILASATGTAIQLWATQSASLIQSLPTQVRSIRSMAFHPDGLTLGLGSLNGTVELWNTSSRRPTWRNSRQLEGISLVSFSPDGSLLAQAEGSTVELTNLARKRSAALKTHQGVPLSAIAFSPDGQTLATASGTAILLWNVLKRKRLGAPIIRHQQSVRALAFTPNGRMLISGGGDRLINLWQPSSPNSPK
ncbi:MAG: serine/threonine-protein kinase [Elainellaceae cyanobacterium]